jgi:hypothetical protein
MLTLGKIFHFLANVALLARRIFRLESDEEARRGRRYQVGYSWKREKRAIVALFFAGIIFSAVPVGYWIMLVFRVTGVGVVRSAFLGHLTVLLSLRFCGVVVSCSLRVLLTVACC